MEMATRKTQTKNKIDLLKPVEREFVLNFLLLKNGTKAYMQAYPKAKYDTARTNSSKLLAKTNIKDAIQEYYDASWKEKEKQISKLFDDLLNVVNADVADYIDENGEIDVKKIKSLNTFPLVEYNRTVSDTAQGQNVKTSVKLLDKLKAISELTKILQMINEKVEIFGDIELIPAVRPERSISQNIDED